MPSLIECVPNFSEGRRAEVVEEIVRTVRQIDDVTLLDFSRDETHNRSVVTFAGSAEPVVKAATAAVGRALELIDMEQHTGAHPRIGSVDVVPFVPLARGLSSMASSALATAIPLQLLAERLARARAKNPDSIGRDDPRQAAAGDA